ncbi:MAG: class I SAM-dependent methyltransferase [Patescibacteria group bacterium]|jgi:hypothetical protein
MAYDQKFFEAYAQYLAEPTVRENHGWVFRIFDGRCNAKQAAVVDLGCGLGEYFRHGAFREYVGVDRHDPGHPGRVISGDYADPAFLRSQLPFPPQAFVSLFSIEACLPVVERYRIYGELFRNFPELTCGLVGGFYYESRRDQETVDEAGNIVSYQTIDRLGEHPLAGIEESRLEMHTPSLMFGPDVVEVWKIFRRI